MLLMVFDAKEWTASSPMPVDNPVHWKNNEHTFNKVLDKNESVTLLI